MGWVVKYQSHFFSGTKTDGIFVKKSTAEFWQICVSQSPSTIRVWIEEVSEERKGGLITALLEVGMMIGHIARPNTPQTQPMFGSGQKEQR